MKTLDLTPYLPGLPPEVLSRRVISGAPGTPHAGSPAAHLNCHFGRSPVDALIDQRCARGWGDQQIVNDAQIAFPDDGNTVKDGREQDGVKFL